MRRGEADSKKRQGASSGPSVERTLAMSHVFPLRRTNDERLYPRFEVF
jgi:hypothetical protein